MKLRTPIVRSIIIISIAVLSLVIGLTVSAVVGRMDKKAYPRGFSDLVEKYSAEYAVPEYVVYAVIKQESGFVSGNVAEDGGIGLMGITEAEFNEMLEETKEILTSDALYGPETNIRYGCLKLSKLFNKLESWELVYGAYYADAAEIEKWISDPDMLDENGLLREIPEESARDEGEKLNKCVEKYKKMYYS